MQSKTSTSTSTIQRSSRPKPKSGFIPPTAMGDILQIWNFFNTFSDLFKCEDIQKEEIYACLTYKGEDSLALLNDMHQGLLSLFLQEYIKKGKFENFKDRTDHPFFVLLKSHVGSKDFDGDELALYWTEFLRKMVILPPCNELFSETTKRFFETLGKKTCLEYNTLEYRQKIKILINLIEALYETDNFRDFIQERIEAVEKIMKEKQELKQEIKQDESAYKELEAKLQKGNSSQIQKELLKQEEAINRKKAKLLELKSEEYMPTQSAFYAGSDVHKSEYWVFQSDSTKLYVRYPEIVSTEEEWYYYDTKSELDQLMKSLNPKGTKEKKLLETLVELIDNGKLAMKNDRIEIENNKENVPPSRLKDKAFEKNKIEEENQEQRDYWISKIMEYDLPLSGPNSRTTRRKVQMDQQSKDRLFQKKSPNELNIQTIKAALLETEERLNIYVAKWNSWWAFPKQREEVLNRIIEVKDVNEMKDLLLDLNELWKYGHSYRDKSQSQADTNSTEDRSKLSEDENEGQEGDSQGGEFDDESSRNSKLSSGQKMQIEEIETRKIKKYPMRFWGMYTDKLKASWINYTSSVDNIAGVYFSALMFCVTINNYVNRMTVRYFTEYKNGKEYMQAKYGNKQNKTKVEVEPMVREKRSVRTRLSVYNDHESSESPETERNKKRGASKEMNIDYLDNYKHSKKTVVKKGGKDKKVDGKSTAESDTYASKLRRRDRSESSEERGYTLRSQKPKGDMSKLEELVNTRKSSRLNKGKSAYQEISEEESDNMSEEEISENPTPQPVRRSTRRIS